MRMILVDDEKLALEFLERQLSKVGDIEIVGKYTDPLIARDEILHRDVDAVFLDISLPELDGIRLADQLLEKKPNLNIIFVTAYNEYAVQAFDLNALDYIVKPVQTERLIKTLDRIRQRINLRAKSHVIHSGDIHLNVFRQVSVGEIGNMSLLQWRTSKAQELFLYLLQHREQLVRKSVLIDLLWQDHDSEKIYSQLYTTVYHIRKALEPYKDRFQIANTTEGYVLHLNQIVLDINEWDRRIGTLPPLTADSIDLYQELTKLYTGDYLQEYDYWWAESERQRYKSQWLKLSYDMGDWHYRNGALEQAAASYLNIIFHDSLEERAYYQLMVIYSEQQPAMVHRQYQLLESVLEEELGEAPSDYITEWYKVWQESNQILKH
ncbi:response regulator [Paenibacillus lutimineralis]|uniref:Response regulator n=1 Tax=Paenibacillus lutimineralis TaxID=2707005 RepID=A0A3S9V0R3_9BACL|nr:response regulator [Paenibacillus lutimineralis]AZS16189.1 response regulator [Paenibacillus lutimineralis]